MLFCLNYFSATSNSRANYHTRKSFVLKNQQKPTKFSSYQIDASMCDMSSVSKNLDFAVLIWLNLTFNIIHSVKPQTCINVQGSDPNIQICCVFSESCSHVQLFSNTAKPLLKNKPYSYDLFEQINTTSIKFPPLTSTMSSPVPQYTAGCRPTAPSVTFCPKNWSSVEKRIHTTTIILEMSLLKLKQSTCACGPVNVPVQSCIHEYMNTFVYMVGAHAQLYMHLHLLACCACMRLYQCVCTS